MNTDRPHEIRTFDPKAFFRDPIERRKWLPLTEDEASILGAMDEDGRATWFAKLGRAEKRRRFHAAEKLVRDSGGASHGAKVSPP